MELQKLIEAFRQGERRALSRAISLAENADESFGKFFDELHASMAGSCRIGVTGPPGAGKSTLLSVMLGKLSKEGSSTGVLAVDPSSPFTGGALLGDRIRMVEHGLDPAIFIRSMASRGSMGGLARQTLEACDLMDAFGFDRLIIETVGVGQEGYDIQSVADLLIVVLSPGAGDSIQTLKAGLFELADLFVINKAENDATRLEMELREMLELRRDKSGDVGCLQTVATEGRGVDEVLAWIEQRYAALEESGELAERRKVREQRRVERLVLAGIERRFFQSVGAETAAARPELELSQLGPYAKAEQILSRILAKGDEDA